MNKINIKFKHIDEVDTLDIDKYFHYIIKRSYEENISTIYFTSSSTNNTIKITIEKSLIYISSSQIITHENNIFDQFQSSIQINCLFLTNIENKEGDYIIYLEDNDFQRLTININEKKENNSGLYNGDKIQDSNISILI